MPPVFSVARPRRTLRRAWPLALLALLLAAVIALPASVRADEGWTIASFDSRTAIQPDGSLAVTETIIADFGSRQMHGIYRDLTYLQDYDKSQNRRYDITLDSVTDGAGHALKVQTLTEGSLRRFKIGDPNKTISGRQQYQIRYHVRGALNAFSDHDELYWNITGVWTVPLLAASVTVTTPKDGINRIACFEGWSGSQEPCTSSTTSATAQFTAARSLPAGQQLTVVVGMAKGVVPEPHPILVAKPRQPTQYFERSPGIVAATAVVAFGALGGIVMLWWRQGRDRRYRTVHYLTNDTREETVPLFAGEPVAVEFQPPEGLKPAQIGVLLDERADTRDVTATIVDLAVRGYLRISEIEKKGLFGKKDWQLDRLKPADEGLLDYERDLLSGLFDATPLPKSAERFVKMVSAAVPSVLSELPDINGKTSVKVSDLKNHFYKDLQKVKTDIDKDATARGWFAGSPNRVRAIYGGIAIAIILGGGALAFFLGKQWGFGLIAIPVALAGLLLMMLSGAMPRRTAAGRELLRRSLGFRRYIETAEKHRQEFNEKAMLFDTYLPYAIVFDCVDKWARAFQGIERPPQAAGGAWYVGPSYFNIGSFSHDFESFAGSVSSAIASTPGGSGGSGFSGGGAGGGGGGGGGGGW